MSTRRISWGKDGRCVRLTTLPPSCAVVMKSGNLNFLGPSVVYEIMLKNTAEPGRSQMTISGMRIACCIAKATNTHSECILLTAFPLQQWVHERAPMFTHSCLFQYYCHNKFVAFNSRITDPQIRRQDDISQRTLIYCKELHQHVPGNNETNHEK